MAFEYSDEELQIRALLQRFRTVTVGGAAACTAASTTLHTPTAGSAVRLKWVGIGQDGNGTDTLVTVKLGATTVYSWPLPTPGAFAHSSLREGAADAALVVTLSPTGPTVYVNYELEEFVPA